MWDNLKASIASVIRTNNNQEITGANLQNVLNTIVNSIGANATFAGVATPSTSPGTPDGPVFWIAGPGTYSNFGQLTVVGDVLGIFVWSDSAWHYDSIVTASDIYNSLNIDDEPTAGSENVVKSGGAFAQYFYFIYGIPSEPDVNKVYYNRTNKILRHFNGTSWETIPYHSNILYCRENIGKQNAPVLYKYNKEDGLVPLGYDYLLLNNVVIPASSYNWEKGLYFNTSTKLIRYFNGSSWETYDMARENCLYFCLSDSRLYRYNTAEQTLYPVINYDGYNYVLNNYKNNNYILMEQGSINAHGVNTSSLTRMRTTDYFLIEEEVEVKCDFAAVGLRYYDADKQYIGTAYTVEAKYLRFFLYSGRMTEQTTNNDFLNNKFIIIGGTTYKFHEYKQFVEDTECYLDSNWKGKKIVWFGTSIPNGKYPQIVGDLLGANILNQSVGASVIAVGYRDGQIPIGINQQRAFSATKAEKEALFGTDSYNKYSFEELLIPYLDGTHETPDAIVLEYGSDWNMCKNDEDRSNFSKLNEESSDVNTLPNDSLTSLLGVNFNRYTYTGAMLFIIQTILKYKPYMRIYVVGYLNDMRRVGDAPAMRTICDYWQIPYCDISSLLGWSDRIIPGSMEIFNAKYSPTYSVDTDVTQFKMWCPDDWHPHTNFNTLSNGYKESNYFLATKVAKWLNSVF